MFSENLKEMRKKRRMTQEQLAEKLKICSGTIAMWETGRRKPNIIMLKRIAAVLDCTTDELLESIEV